MFMQMLENYLSVGQSGNKAQEFLFKCSPFSLSCERNMRLRDKSFSTSA